MSKMDGGPAPMANWTSIESRWARAQKMKNGSARTRVIAEMDRAKGAIDPSGTARNDNMSNPKRAQGYTVSKGGKAAPAHGAPAPWRHWQEA